MTAPTKKHWSSDDGVCELCGIEFEHRIPEAEMFHEENVDEVGSLVVHRACGLRRGMEFA